MSGLRTCRVTLPTTEGVAHTVEVTAETLFEAAALGLAELRKEPWSSPTPPSAVLEVVVTSPATTHTVSCARWLAEPPRSPEEKLWKARLLTVAEAVEP